MNYFVVIIFKYYNLQKNLKWIFSKENCLELQGNERKSEIEKSVCVCVFEWVGNIEGEGKEKDRKREKEKEAEKVCLCVNLCAANPWVLVHIFTWLKP